MYICYIRLILTLAMCNIYSTNSMYLCYIYSTNSFHKSALKRTALKPKTSFLHSSENQAGLAHSSPS